MQAVIYSLPVWALMATLAMLAMTKTRKRRREIESREFMEKLVRAL